jgi:flagellar biosynthesis/type III secretory pathway M-ring protein FliF/YscJ
VEAIAGTVAGAISGLDVRNVRVVDERSRKQFMPQGDNDFSGGTYLEQQAKTEERVQQKALGLLANIPGVIVVATAVIDATRSTSEELRIAPKNEGSTSLVSRETISETVQTDRTDSGEPGPRSNTEANVATGGGGTSSLTTTDTETEFDARFGHDSKRTEDPGGRPKAISLAVNVPREYVAAVVKEEAGDAEKTPTSDEIRDAWENLVKPDIERVLRPVVLTDAGMDEVAEGAIVVNLMPVALAAVGLAPASSDGAGGGGVVGTLSSLAGGDTVQTGMLVALAVMALGMMLLMVRKAGKSAPLPSAEELVGVPPALQHDEDLVGEADEGETAMAGIEIDDEAMRSRKMLDEVNDMVKNRPDLAASLMTRWLDLDR